MAVRNLQHIALTVPVATVGRKFYSDFGLERRGVGACRLLGKGYRNGWGFGRHVTGSNFFHYIRDPWNSRAEYVCDIDYIPGDTDWKATNHPAEDTLCVRGPKVPAGFGASFGLPD
jgi:hypothetical protein